MISSTAWTSTRSRVARRTEASILDRRSRQDDRGSLDEIHDRERAHAGEQDARSACRSSKQHWLPSERARMRSRRSEIDFARDIDISNSRSS